MNSFSCVEFINLNEKEAVMANCELLEGCLFFNDKMSEDSGLGAIYKKKYCLGDNTQCARYRVAKKLGRKNVPTNLYPNMIDTAENLISAA